MRRLILFALLFHAPFLGIAPQAIAQSALRAAPSHLARPVASRAPQISSTLVALPEARPFHRFANPYRSLFLPFGNLYDAASLSPDPNAAQPPLDLMQVLSSLGKTDLGKTDLSKTDLNKNEAQPLPPSQPLLIELRGDRYVRIPDGDAGSSQPASQETAGVSTIPAKTYSSARTLSAKIARQVLSPAVLIFRDGHSEEVRDYAIVGGVIYARGDYYTDGYWTKKIELLALNLPQTIKSNEERGVRFMLPSAPNEVITRP